MSQSQDNQLRARRGAFAVLCATEGQVDRDFVSLAVRNLITNLAHYCDTEHLQFRRINKGALRDWEQQRLADK